ncbi:hypothetical protein BIW11_10715 [Tropilaelaps mercedesae]|uniref:Uncharacterized protein n=1 Tax=Tropilaelaps mercedesae TaxID=418985 RepID=A0A1V9XED3_9ACAR|nr:hypothetical protein BIW11_10715 [Tropilaelaps mercedesae]
MMLLHFVVLAGTFKCILCENFCFPTNMHRFFSAASCESGPDGAAYMWVPKGEVIPCSPVCQLKYRFTEEKYLSARRIYEVCKYHPEKKMFYHGIADRNRCACRDWAAYERKEDRWINHYNVTWFCNPEWNIKRTEFVGVYMVDCDRQDHMVGLCEQDCSNATMWPPQENNLLEHTFIRPKCQPKLA